MQSGDIIAARYRLDRLLGEGGLAQVWEAWQTGIDRRVAIKFLKGMPSENLRVRFEVEAKALGRLAHPNCVTVHDFGYAAGGEPFLVMEHLSGRDLSELRGVDLPIGRILEIMSQVAAALVYAHANGVVHRDLKPENVFLLPSDIVKVVDFGLAKLGGPASFDITETGEFAGTPAYMSPEQLQGLRDAGPSSDLYSFGIMLFELIERRLPFEGRSVLELAHQHLSAAPPSIRRPDCPPELAAIVARLLKKKPEQRFSDADALSRALAAVNRPPVAPTASDDALVPTQQGPPPRPGKPPPLLSAPLSPIRRLLPIGLVGVALTAILFGPWRANDPQPDPVIEEPVAEPDVAAEPETPCLGVTTAQAWQVHGGAEPVPWPKTSRHGDPSDYEFSEIPLPDDSGWRPSPASLAPTRQSTMCANAERPDLYECLAGGEFTYFQTFFDIPTGLPIRSLQVDVDVVDDGVAITLFNFAHGEPHKPQGYVYLDVADRIDLTPDAAPGRNRLVLTHVDDCCGLRKLDGVRVLLNGEELTACDAQ